MLTYPITPDYILRLPDATQRAMLQLEEYLLKDICMRLRINETFTGTAAQHIMMLYERGYDMTRISARIAQMTGIAEREVREAMLDVLKQNGEYYTALYEACGSSIYPTFSLAADLDAITRVTQLEMSNITRSLGFALRDGKGVLQWYEPAKAYQKVLDEALVKVNAGLSYEQSIRSAVRQLTDSGIQTVEYQRMEDGAIKTHFNRADVAARRAVMTGITKVSQAYADKACADLNTHYVEVSAHSGARDIDKPNPWSNHKAWQGKIYSLRAGDIYPSIYVVCGLDEVDGICGANCRHTYHPWVPGVMERTYTDEELQNIDKPPFTYKDKEYTTYEATQTMRKAEASMRDLKRKMIGCAASGDRERYLQYAARFKGLESEYAAFVKASGLRSQRERGNLIEWGPKERKEMEELLMAAESKGG